MTGSGMVIAHSFDSINLVLKRFLTVALGLSLGSSQGIWEEFAPLPEPRSEHGAVVIDSLIYVMGGRSGGHQHTSGQLWSYNPATNSWNTTLPSLNKPRTELAAVAIGDTLLVFGGRVQSEIVKEVERYIPGRDTWEVITSMPEARSGLGAVRVDSMIYIIGGKSSSGMFALPTTRVDRYNIRTGEWSLGPDLNQARFKFSYGVDNGTIICAGGSYLDPIMSVEVLADPSVWTDEVNLDEPRSGGAGIYLDNDFIITGGFISSGTSTMNLHLRDGQWEEFPGLLVPRYDHTAVVLDGRIYVMGGRSGHQALGTAERYSTTVSIDVPHASLPESLHIRGPYPNPFNGFVKLDLFFPRGREGNLSIRIIDLRGNQIYREMLPGIYGEYQLHLDFTKGELHSTPSGTYFLLTEWRSSEQLVTRVSKMVYLK